MKTLKRIWNYLTFLNNEKINAQVFMGRGKF